ncbi:MULTISPECIES: hypothetical protein [unclassified Microcoleus]|uniref:hypothetical protein n=1 Tax=unclassified Microcoleus TaxID=2642155 RepID=UPI0025E89FFC|nr:MULTISPECIES: hypothetical protein [unclassified Microcoleus]
MIPEFKHFFSTNSHREKFATEKTFFRAPADKKKQSFVPANACKKNRYFIIEFSGTIYKCHES